MRRYLLIAGSAALAACQQQAAAPANDVNTTEAIDEADANVVAADAIADATATNNYNESSWEFTYKDKPMLESIDASGNYITESAGKHIDHGTSVMKGTKICFTSTMKPEDGEDCWQDPKLEIGQTGESVSDKGEKVTLKRVAYQPLKMPS